MTHDELVIRGEKWLQKQNCKVTIRDECRISTENGELPDVIGWRDGISILIEAKVSRSDFLSDKTKPFRISPNRGMGDWRFYLCLPGIIHSGDLPTGWGLLYVMLKSIKKVHAIPSNCNWHSQKPFNGEKVSENRMLVSALRRLSLQGYLEKIYSKEYH